MSAPIAKQQQHSLQQDDSNSCWSSQCKQRKRYRLGHCMSTNTSSSRSEHTRLTICQATGRCVPKTYLTPFTRSCGSLACTHGLTPARSRLTAAIIDDPPSGIRDCCVTMAVTTRQVWRIVRRWSGRDMRGMSQVDAPQRDLGGEDEKMGRVGLE